MSKCRFRWLLARVVLIDVRERHLLVADLLYRLDKLADLISVLLVGRRDVQGQQVAWGIDGDMHFEPFLRLAHRSRYGCRWSASIAASGYPRWRPTDGVRAHRPGATACADREPWPRNGQLTKGEARQVHGLCRRYKKLEAAIMPHAMATPKLTLPGRRCRQWD